MTLRSANKPGDLVLTSFFWMTGFFFVASALCGAHAEQQNQAEATTFGYVVNGIDNTVSVIDTANNKVEATIPVGNFPDGVATTPDGSRAYVTNGFDNSVSVIDTTTNRVVATIPVGSFPEGVAITPDGTHLYEDDDRRHQPLAYVTNGEDDTVSVINTAKNTVIATISVGIGPNAVAITSDGTHAYVVNQLDNTISMIDTASNTVVDTFTVGNFPTGVAIRSDRNHSVELPGLSLEYDDPRHPSLAYVTNQLDETVSVIDTDNNTVVATIPVTGEPTGVAITPDGTHAYVAIQVSDPLNTVSVIDTARNKVVDTIMVGFAPNGVAITPDETQPPELDNRRHPPLAYVTNTDDDTVSVIDAANNKVVATIPVGALPFAVAFAIVTPPHSK